MRADGRQTARGWTTPRRVVLAVSAALMTVLGVVLAAQADVLTARPLVEVRVDGVDPALVVTSDWSASSLKELAPGTPAYWLVDAWVVGVEGARLTLEIRKDGELMEVPHGVTLTVERCGEPWVDVPEDPACPEAQALVAVAEPEDDLSAQSPSFWIDTVDTRQPSYVLVTLALADTPEARADESLMGLTGMLGLGITAVEAIPGEPGEPTDPPTEQPTEEPTAPPTVEPTAPPTAPPSGEPTGEPTGPPGSDPGLTVPPEGGGPGQGTPGAGPSRPGGPDGLSSTGTDLSVLVWAAGLALVVGGVLTGATVVEDGRRARRRSTRESGGGGAT